MSQRIWAALLSLNYLGHSPIWGKVWAVNGLFGQRGLRVNRTFQGRMIGTKLTASAGNLMETLAHLNRFFEKTP
jgi:hypothetical protein